MKIKASKYLLSKCAIVSEKPLVIPSALRLNKLPEELYVLEFFTTGVEVTDDFDLAGIPNNWYEVER